MAQETLKWIIFPFSLMGRAKQWYNLNVQSVEGKWEVLREKFCRTFSLAQISDLRCEIILFKQKKGESLGTAWARFINILASGPDLGIPEPTCLQQFRLGLNAESAKFLDSSSGGSFIDLTLNEGRVILEKNPANTPYTAIYYEFPEEPPEMQLKEPSIEIPEPKDATPSHTPTFTTAHVSDTISEPIPKPFSDSCDSPCEFPFNFYDKLFHDFGNATNQPLVGRHLPPKDQRDHPTDLEESQWQEQYIGNLSAIMSQEWLEEAESSAEVIRLPTRLRSTNCMVIGMDGSFRYDLGLGINIISSSLVQTKLSEERLSSSQKRLHVAPTQSLDCRGILRAAPVRIANPTLYLDFHVFDFPENLSHNIIIGRPIMKILEKYQGTKSWS
jgi:hypothetical protein